MSPKKASRGRSPELSGRAASQDPPSARSSSRERNLVAAQLVGRCASGDQEALAELHALYSGNLLGLVRGIVREPEAQEVVQEVFMYLWRRADCYDPRLSTVLTWLKQIARCRAIDHLRRAGARQRAYARVATEDPPSLEPQVEREIFRHQLRRRVGRALERLPAPQREAVLLAYFEDLTQREIAMRSSVPLGTVKTRTFLAMRKLRADLEPELLEAR